MRALERECAVLMKRQIVHEGQVETRRTGHLVVDRVRVLIGELEHGQRHVGGDRHVELALAVRRHHERLIADAARDLLPIVGRVNRLARQAKTTKAPALERASWRKPT